MRKGDKHLAVGHKTAPAAAVNQLFEGLQIDFALLCRFAEQLRFSAFFCAHHADTLKEACFIRRYAFLRASFCRLCSCLFFHSHRTSEAKIPLYGEFLYSSTLFTTLPFSARACRIRRVVSPILH